MDPSIFQAFILVRVMGLGLQAVLGGMAGAHPGQEAIKHMRNEATYVVL